MYSPTEINYSDEVATYTPTTSPQKSKDTPYSPSSAMSPHPQPLKRARRLISNFSKEVLTESNAIELGSYGNRATRRYGICTDPILHE